MALLGLGTAGLVAHLSDDDVDVESKADEIVELTNYGPLDLSRDVDRLLDERGKPKDVPPGMAVALGTTAVIGVTLATETDIVADALADLGDVGGRDD